MKRLHFPSLSGRKFDFIIKEISQVMVLNKLKLNGCENDKLNHEKLILHENLMIICCEYLGNIRRLTN